MKRLFVLAVLAVSVLLLCSFARAGDVVTKKSKDITISGEIRLDAIFQDRDSVGVIYPNWPLPPEGEFEPGPHSVTFVDPRITLNLDATFAEKIRAFLQLRTPPYLQDDFGAPPLRLLDSGGNTIEYPVRVLEVKQAYLLMNEFAWENFSVCLGVQSLRYELREDGNAFFLGIGESESPFPPAGGRFFDTRPSATPVRDFELWAPGRVGTTEAGGIKTTYRLKRELMKCELSIDTFFAVIEETRQLSEDQDILGVIVNLWMPEAKEALGKVSLGITSLTYGNHGRIWTYGGGGTFKCSKDFEVFAEAYGQGGKFYDSFDPTAHGTPPTEDELYWLSRKPGVGDIKQLAFAGYGGARCTFKDNPWQPFVEASYWWISGDKDNTDRRQQNFISYEDVNDTLIIEDGQYGFDIDTNYEALKCKAGFKPNKETELSVLFGTFQRARDRRAHDKLGDEIDFGFKWDYTEDATFKARLGLLSDSDYISEATGHARVFTVGQVEAILRF